MQYCNSLNVHRVNIMFIILHVNKKECNRPHKTYQMFCHFKILAYFRFDQKVRKVRGGTLSNKLGQ